ncbi:MAG: PepSY domain-containing protein [Pseudomonadota bacterium]
MKKVIFILAVMAAAVAPVSMAQNWGQSFSPNQARDARQSGDIVPLRDIIRRLQRQHGGRYLDANLYSKSGGGSEYHIDWLTEDGRKVVFVVDARSGRVTSTRGG